MMRRLLTWALGLSIDSALAYDAPRAKWWGPVWE